MVEFDFSDKIALVTGGTGAVGSQLLRFFTNKGATAIGTYLDDKKMNYLSPRFQNVEFVRCNTVIDTEVSYLVDHIVSKHGRIDVLVNTVGGYLGSRSVFELDENEWDKMLTINLKSAYMITKYVVPLMIRSGYGRMVHISSYTGTVAQGFDSAYAASKAGLIRFVEAVSKEVKGHDLTVNCILPSIIDTESNRKMMPEGDTTRWVSIDELVTIIAFLSSKDSRAITGAAIPVLNPS